MFHEGQTGAAVTLDRMLPNSDLYAVGALAGLAGEITIVAGTVHLSYPQGPEDARTETVSRSEAGAALLVAAEVPGWHSVRTESAIPFEAFDEEIGRLAASVGLSLTGRFPFLLEGEFEELRWHVIDGRGLQGGGTSHEDHLVAAVRIARDRAPATLVGFYSSSDQGVFTHAGSRTHVHCVLDDAAASGHVDHVVVPAGTTVRFPVTGDRPGDAGIRYEGGGKDPRDPRGPARCGPSGE
jgi:acetolactate decarboxylase